MYTAGDCEIKESAKVSVAYHHLLESQTDKSTGVQHLLYTFYFLLFTVYVQCFMLVSFRNMSAYGNNPQSIADTVAPGTPSTLEMFFLLSSACVLS